MTYFEREILRYPQDGMPPNVGDVYRLTSDT